MKIPVVDLSPKKHGIDANAAWWTETTDVFQHTWALASALHNQSATRRADNLRHARLFSNRQYLSMAINSKAQSGRTVSDSARLTLNVVNSCISTACAKISQSRPRALFLTSGGDFKLQMKAKQLSKYIEGLFDAENVYQLGQQVFRDSLVFGIGIIKVLNNGESVSFERVLPDEIMLDEGEAFYGQPRQIHQRRFIAREVLVGLFPKHAESIRTAQSSFAEEDSANPDLIPVLESWHLASSSDAKDGKRVVSISNATLVEAPYEYAHFPFAILRWSESLTGWWGTGLTEELTPLQIEINKLLRNIQAAQDICAVPRVFIEAGSSVNGASLQANPQGLSVVRYQGTKPDFMTASAMPGEIYSHLDRLVNKAYEITGISQLSAASKKPAGLDSGVAIREYQDIESERFQLVGQRYEKFFLDLAKLAVEESKTLFEANPKLNVLVAIKGRAEKIVWKDVQLKRDQYLLRCFPTSLLPTTPAGRLQKVQELMQAGFIEKNEAMALLDFPDLERSMSLNTSAYEDTLQTLERIVQDGHYDTPEPYQNLALALKMAQSMYLRARVQEVPEDRLELLRRYIDDCDQLLSKAEPPAPAPIAMPAPMAVPEPNPTSDLMPV